MVKPNYPISRLCLYHKLFLLFLSTWQVIIEHKKRKKEKRFLRRREFNRSLFIYDSASPNTIIYSIEIENALPLTYLLKASEKL